MNAYCLALLRRSNWEQIPMVHVRLPKVTLPDVDKLGLMQEEQNLFIVPVSFCLTNFL